MTLLSSYRLISYGFGKRLISTCGGNYLRCRFWEVHDDYLHWMVFGNDSHQSCFRMLVENRPKSFHNSTITGNVTIPLKPEGYPSPDQVGLLYT